MLCYSSVRYRCLDTLHKQDPAWTESRHWEFKACRLSLIACGSMRQSLVLEIHDRGDYCYAECYQVCQLLSQVRSGICFCVPWCVLPILGSITLIYTCSYVTLIMVLG